MKRSVILINAVLASVITLSGCSTIDVMSTGSAASTSNQHLKAVKPDQVKIYHGKRDMPKHYTVVGRVATQSYNFVGMPISQSSIMEELKKQAASIGANGITHITTGLAETTAEAILVK